MLAKLRAGSGNESRSWLPTTPPRTALDVSIVSAVIEEGMPFTFTNSCAPSGFSVTSISRTTLTATSTSAVAWAKPAAVTTTRYEPGCSPSILNSPWPFPVAVRLTEEPVAWTTIRAPGTRAARASWTSPRSVPLEFWARRSKGTSAMTRRTRLNPLIRFAVGQFPCV